jgi:hypothetical protein
MRHHSATPYPPAAAGVRAGGSACSRGPTTRAVCLAFAPGVSMDEVSATLDLAVLAAQSLYGVERLQLDADWHVDAAARTVAVDTAPAAGRTLAMILLGYVRREFGDAAVRVTRATAGRPWAGVGR